MSPEIFWLDKSMYHRMGSDEGHTPQADTSSPGDFSRQADTLVELPRQANTLGELPRQAYIGQSRCPRQYQVGGTQTHQMGGDCGGKPASVSRASGRALARAQSEQLF